MALFNLSPLAWWKGGVQRPSRSPSGGSSQNGEHNHIGHSSSSPSPGASRRTTLLWRLSSWLDATIESTMKVAQPVMITVAFTLISFVTYIYFFTILPYSGVELFSPRGLVQTAFGLWILFNIFFNYASCILSSPGGTEVLGDKRADIETGGPLVVDGRRMMVLCRTCDRLKPERAHHCSLCKRCIARMDHHCPWMANCIGVGNYRYFVLFLWYLFWGCAFILFCTIPPLITKSMAATSPPMRSASGKLKLYPNFFVLNFLLTHREDPNSVWIFFAVLLCSAVSVAMFIMGSFHFYLVFTGQTTIELSQNRNRSQMNKEAGIYWTNPYNYGRIMNFQLVFGVVGRKLWWLLWMMPVRSRDLNEQKCLRNGSAFDYTHPKRPDLLR